MVVGRSVVFQSAKKKKKQKSKSKKYIKIENFIISKPSYFSSREIVYMEFL